MPSFHELHKNKLNDSSWNFKYEKIMTSLNPTHLQIPSALSPADFKAKSAELEALLTGHWLTDLANFSAFLFHEMPDLNWAGFYLSDGRQLILGPFAGKPACTSIRFDRGVCGASFSKREALLVKDVHEFPGHIACDAASNSEMVLPVIVENECLGVLDLDSPLRARFRDEDREGVTIWLDVLLRRCDLRPLSQVLKAPASAP